MMIQPLVCAGHRVAFVLNLVDLGDEELPGALGAREV